MNRPALIILSGLGAFALCSCTQIGTIRVLAGYSMGAAADSRTINAEVDFVLRDPVPGTNGTKGKNASDGKRIVASISEPDCAGGGR